MKDAGKRRNDDGNGIPPKVGELVVFKKASDGADTEEKQMLLDVAALLKMTGKKGPFRIATVNQEGRSTEVEMETERGEKLVLGKNECCIDRFPVSWIKRAA